MDCGGGRDFNSPWNTVCWHSALSPTIGSLPSVTWMTPLFCDMAVYRDCYMPGLSDSGLLEFFPCNLPTLTELSCLQEWAYQKLQGGLGEKPWKPHLSQLKVSEVKTSFWNLPAQPTPVRCITWVSLTVITGAEKSPRWAILWTSLECSSHSYVLTQVWTLGLNAHQENPPPQLPTWPHFHWLSFVPFLWVL